ncbi:MAG TPA: hypothetical protein VKP67_00970, partial [Xanthobacteraceae bacterium]|nr:hypothetical protein [Xanthobacteraceae bacterium]
MLPAVAVRELVTGDTRVINPDDEASPSNAVSATANKPPLRFGAHRPAVPVHLVVARQHGLKSVRPPYELRRRLYLFRVREAAPSRRDVKIRCP